MKRRLLAAFLLVFSLIIFSAERIFTFGELMENRYVDIEIRGCNASTGSAVTGKVCNILSEELLVYCNFNEFEYFKNTGYGQDMLIIGLYPLNAPVFFYKNNSRCFFKIPKEGIEISGVAICMDLRKSNPSDSEILRRFEFYPTGKLRRLFDAYKKVFSEEYEFDDVLDFQIAIWLIREEFSEFTNKETIEYIKKVMNIKDDRIEKVIKNYNLFD